MTIDRWDLLRTVTVVAQFGSYRRAAKELGVSKTTVARHIEKLQLDLGAQVFKMVNGSLVLTEVGTELDQISRDFKEQVDHISSGIGSQGVYEGALRLTTLSFIANYFLAEPCSEWRRKFPKGTLSIDASDHTLAIEMGEADVALRLSRPDTLGITRFKVGVCPVGVFTPKGTVSDEWVGLPEALDALPEMRMASKYFGRPPSIRMDSFSAIAKASGQSGLACILPTCLAPHFPDLTQVGEHQNDTVVLRELWLLFHEKRSGDPVIRAAVDWVKHVFPGPNQCLCGQCHIGSR